MKNTQKGKQERNRQKKNMNSFKWMCVQEKYPAPLARQNTGGADKPSVLLGRKKPTATEDFDFHISYL